MLLDKQEVVRPKILTIVWARRFAEYKDLVCNQRLQSFRYYCLTISLFRYFAGSPTYGFGAIHNFDNQLTSVKISKYGGLDGHN